MWRYVPGTTGDGTLANLEQGPQNIYDIAQVA